MEDVNGGGKVTFHVSDYIARFIILHCVIEKLVQAVYPMLHYGRI